ncbi:MAG: hypothetical protein GY899_11585 [Verrucomicrobiaceae bacterium]|nr:hypothetical protein [Verrucomicrobiaceae bacterium]
MTSTANQITSALRDESWELDLTPELCGKFLSELNRCDITIINPEISCSFRVDEPKVIIDKSCLCLPESGLNIEFRNVLSALLSKDPLLPTKLNLVLTSLDRDEQLTIELPRPEEKAVGLLTKELIRTHDHLPASATMSDQHRSLCPCCTIKRDETRSRISSHPLYHIISFACFINQDIWLDFNRSMTSCSRAFSPTRECHPEGVISLTSPEGIMAIDLGEVFQCIAHLADFEGDESTIFQCYNSHGNLLFSLIQKNSKLFEVWNLMNQKSQD